MTKHANLDDDDQTIRIELYYMKNINTVSDFLQINNNISKMIKPSNISIGNGTNMGESNPYYESPSASPTPDSSNNSSTFGHSSNNSSTFGHSFTCSVTGATVTSLIR